MMIGARRIDEAGGILYGNDLRIACPPGPSPVLSAGAPRHFYSAVHLMHRDGLLPEQLSTRCNHESIVQVLLNEYKFGFCCQDNTDLLMHDCLHEIYWTSEPH